MIPHWFTTKLCIANLMYILFIGAVFQTKVFGIDGSINCYRPFRLEENCEGERKFGEICWLLTTYSNFQIGKSPKISLCHDKYLKYKNLSTNVVF